MKRKRFLYILFSCLIFQMAYPSEYNYFIVKDINTVVYQEPNIKSKIIDVKYGNFDEFNGFFENELLRTDRITNIKGVKWALIYKDIPEYSGWIKMTNIYRFDDGENGKLFYEILQKQIIGHINFKNTRIADVAFTNFNNGYVMIHYSEPDSSSSEANGIYYKFENDSWIPVVEDSGIYSEYIFYKHYIILLDSFASKFTIVYDTHKMYLDEKRYEKVFITALYEGTNNDSYVLNDSYAKFDTNTGILTAYLRIEKDKPFVLKRYQFDETNGKFIFLGYTNAEAQTQIASVKTNILTGDNVNVRAEAAANGAVLLKLSRGAKVTLLKRSDTALTVGDKKGYWAFIDTGIANKDGEGTIKGWVFDYYLKEEK